MWHDSICNTVQEPTVTSIIVAKKTTTWGESGFPSEFLGSAWVLWALVPFAVAGTVLPGHPFDVLYNYGARFLTGGPRLPKYGAPKHFACAVGAAWVASTGAAFYFGQAYLGYALGGSMVAAAAIPAITDFCIPSFV